MGYWESSSQTTLEGVLLGYPILTSPDTAGEAVFHGVVPAVDDVARSARPALS